MKKLIGLAAVVFTSVAANAATNYLFYTINVPGSFPHSTLPRAINNENVIAGYYMDDTAFLWHGFTYDVNKNVWVNPIDYPGSQGGTYLNAINDSGDLAGYVNAPLSTTQAILDIGGVFGTEYFWCDFGTSYQTNGLNNAGYTAGACQMNGPTGYGSLSWVWAQGNAVLFGCPTLGVSSAANAINNKGQVVGWYAAGPVVAGYLANYSTCVAELNFPGTTYTNLTGINDSGLVIGTGTSPNSPPVGFFYNTSTGQYTTITPPSAAVNGLATAGLNNADVWVGYYFDKNNNAVAFYALHPIIVIIP